MSAPSDAFLALIAGRFRVLAEPARLRILHTLQTGEQSVSELVNATGYTQGNVSKHLQVLHATGFVGRRRDGLFVYYHIADAQVFDLCHMMCGRLEVLAEQTSEVLAGR